MSSRTYPLGLTARRLRAITAALFGLVLAAGIGTAVASWVTNDSSNNAIAAADSMTAGKKPSIGTVSGRDVPLSWAASTTMATNTPVSGYVITRWDASSGGSSSTPGGTCAGLVAALSCTDVGAPSGSNYYTVTPKLGNWVGATSMRSNVATVASPLLQLASTNYTAAGGTTTATVSGFVDNEGVTFCLDDNTLPCASIGSLSVPASGGTANTTVSIPAGTTVGSHTVYAIGNAGDSPAGVGITVTVATASKLVFTTSAPATKVPLVTGTISVQRQDAFGNPTTTGSVTVFLSSTSAGGVFRNTADNANITSVSIGSGASSASFRYKDTLAGSPTIKAADQASVPDTGLTDATQTVTVDKGDQTVTFTSSVPGSATYGGTTYTVSATASSGLTPTITVDASATSVCSIAGSTVSFIGVGTCVLNGNQAGDSNWSAAPQAQQSFAVGKATLTVTASSPTMVYGDSAPTVTPGYSGFKFSDNAGNSITTPPTCTTTATNTSTVSSTPTTSCSGGTSSKYNFSFVGGTVTVQRAPLTVSATPVSASFLYGGTPPTITPSYSGFKNGQSSSVFTTQPTCSAGATSTSIVGNYTSSCSGAAAANYSFSYVTGTVTVNPAPLVITASSGTMTYGTNPPAVTASYSGFVNGQNNSVLTAQPTCTTTATNTANAGGAYTTSCSGAAAQNYAISYVAGTMTISKANQTISFTAPSTANNPGNATMAATATSGLTVSFSSATTSVCTTGGTNGATVTYIAAGICTISADQPGDTNYNAAPQVQSSTVVGFAIGSANNTSARKYTFSGAGGTAGSTVTVTVCAVNSFPCTTGGGGNTLASLTATVAANGTWTTNESGNLASSGTQVWVRAVQGSPSKTSPIFTFTV